MRTKTVALLFAALLLLTACGAPSAPSPAQTATAAPAAAAGSSAQPAGPAATNGGAEREFYEFTLMQNFTPIDQPDFSVEYFKRLEEKLNTKINFQVPAASNYNEALQIMLAGGDYPDAVLMSSVSDQAFIDAVNNNLLVSITPFIQEYGKNIIEYSYPISIETLKAKGDAEIYGIPRTTVLRADGFGIRKDWAEKLKLTLPEEGGSISLDGFTELLRAFTYDDPNGNGVKDTFGLRNQSTGGVLSVHGQIGWSFGLVGWQEIDGEYVDLQYSQKHDNYKRALAYMNKLWKEGYVDPDWPSITNEVAQQRFEAGIYGVQTMFAGHVTQNINTIRKVNPEGDLIWIAGIENAEGKVKGGSYSDGLWNFTSIMSTAKKPERIVEVYDYMLSDDGWTDTVYGPKGMVWDYDASGKMQNIYPDINIGQGWFRNMVRRSENPQFFVGLDVPAENRQKVLNLIQLSIDNNQIALNAGFVAPVTTDLKFIDYKTELDKVVTKIIVGDLPVDAWDEALAGYYKAGYQTFADQTIAFIKAKNGK